MSETRYVQSTVFQREYGRIVDEVRSARDTVILTAHGRPQVVIISPQEYDALQSAQAELARIRRGGAL